jgi:anaerobic ribonucleoside-triphosphate reductase
MTTAQEKIVANIEAKCGQGQGFERIRRITGYLVGTLDRFNDAKRAEERDRVKHGLSAELEPRS